MRHFFPVGELKLSHFPIEDPASPLMLESGRTCPLSLPRRNPCYGRSMCNREREPIRRELGGKELVRSELREPVSPADRKIHIGGKVCG